VLDDDSNLRGRLVMGYNVLGSLDDLPEVLREHRINRIVLTTTLPADRRERLIAVAREAGVPASEWTITEKTLV
jgi:FlaA1/EpsC-like NDP-sugar epimerase